MLGNAERASSLSKRQVLSRTDGIMKTGLAWVVSCTYFGSDAFHENRTPVRKRERYLHSDGSMKVRLGKG